MGNFKGLTSSEVLKLQTQYGYNEVNTAQTPEWKKVAWRYLDWVSIIIVRNSVPIQCAWYLPSAHANAHRLAHAFKRSTRVLRSAQVVALRYFYG